MTPINVALIFCHFDRIFVWILSVMKMMTMRTRTSAISAVNVETLCVAMAVLIRFIYAASDWISCRVAAIGFAVTVYGMELGSIPAVNQMTK